MSIWKSLTDHVRKEEILSMSENYSDRSFSRQIREISALIYVTYHTTSTGSIRIRQMHKTVHERVERTLRGSAALISRLWSRIRSSSPTNELSCHPHCWQCRVPGDAVVRWTLFELQMKCGSVSTCSEWPYPTKINQHKHTGAVKRCVCMCASCGPMCYVQWWCSRKRGSFLKVFWCFLALTHVNWLN